MKHSDRFIAIAQDAKKQINETDTTTLKQRMDRGDQFHLVDVREESEWNNGHLPCAIHISKGVLERDIERAIPDTKAEIILYCGGGSRSALAALNLQKMGYTNVVSLDGGFRGWCAAGYQLASKEE